MYMFLLSTVTRCPELTAPLNGHFIDGWCDTYSGYTCVMACDPGFSLVDGNIERQCHDSEQTTCDAVGSWFGEHPSCQGKSLRMHFDSMKLAIGTTFISQIFFKIFKYITKFKLQDYKVFKMCIKVNQCLPG